MLIKTIQSEVDDEYDYYGKFNLFLIKNNDDLAEFIKNNFVGGHSETNKIPYKEWFIYQVDDSGDYIFDNFILLKDFQTDLLKNIINSTLLYKQLQEI